MFVVIALAFPLLLLLAVLGMERVERPLERSRVARQLNGYLDPAADRDTEMMPDTVEKLIADGFHREVRQYWRRERLRSSLRKFPRPRASAPREAVAPDLSSAPRGG